MILAAISVLAIVCAKKRPKRLPLRARKVLSKNIMILDSKVEYAGYK